MNRRGWVCVGGWEAATSDAGRGNSVKREEERQGRVCPDSSDIDGETEPHWERSGVSPRMLISRRRNLNLLNRVSLKTNFCLLTDTPTFLLRFCRDRTRIVVFFFKCGVKGFLTHTELVSATTNENSYCSTTTQL